MKQDDLFTGAIVLVRPHNGQKRQRCVITNALKSVSTVRDKGGHHFIADNEDIKPAKITPKALMGLGFKWETSSCTAGREHFCGQYKYPDQRNIRVTLKENCNLWDSTVMFWQGVRKVSYIHEVQKFLSYQ